MKKSSLLVLALISFGLISACGGNDPPSYSDNNSDRDSSVSEKNDAGNGTHPDEPDAKNTSDTNPNHPNDANPSDSLCETTITPCGTCDLGAVIHCSDTTDPLHDTCKIAAALE